MTVFLVDDDAAVRDALALFLEGEGLTVESYASAEAFLAAWKRGQSGCAVIDLRMSGMDGMQLMEEMSGRGILLPVIFLTGYGDISTGVRAIKAGAVDFLIKPAPPAQLLEAIHSALTTTAKTQSQAEMAYDAASRLAGLSGREREVMALLVEGLSNKEIALRLGISHRTVEIHKAHVMRKTEARTLLDLIRIAKAVEGAKQ